MDTHCPKCLTSRSDDVLGALCRTHGCDGVISRQPQWSELVERLPEPMTCGRRGESPTSSRFPGPDYWEKFKTNGQRVCSYCGSLHYDDFRALLKRAVEEEGVSIDPSDKGYKIYVRQPGVRNAHEGGIKFYTHHLPRDAAGKIAISEAEQQEYVAAVRKSRERFQQQMTMDARSHQVH